MQSVGEQSKYVCLALFVIQEPSLKKMPPFSSTRQFSSKKIEKPDTKHWFAGSIWFFYPTNVCDELITHPEESYRLWYIVVCGLENSWMGRSWPTGGCRAKKQTNPTNGQLISGLTSLNLIDKGSSHYCLAILKDIVVALSDIWGSWAAPSPTRRVVNTLTAVKRRKPWHAVGRKANLPNDIWEDENLQLSLCNKTLSCWEVSAFETMWRVRYTHWPFHWYSFIYINITERVIQRDLKEFSVNNSASKQCWKLRFLPWSNINYHVVSLVCTPISLSLCRSLSPNTFP
jgi:hypothetical protein